VLSMLFLPLCSTQGHALKCCLSIDQAQLSTDAAEGLSMTLPSAEGSLGSNRTGERFDASQEGLFTKDNKFKHQDGNEGGQAAETGCGYPLKKAGKSNKSKRSK
jgi:hypothetical protein